MIPPDLLKSAVAFSAIFGLSFFGGLISGVVVGHLMLQVRWLSRVLRRICRVALWIPLLVLWPLPIWFHASSSTELWIIAVSITAVMGKVVYHYLSINMTGNLETRRKLVYLSRVAIVQSLLISLILHRFLFSHSWFPVFPGLGETRVGYLAAIILLLILVVVDYLLLPDAEEVLRIRRQSIMHEMGDIRRGDPLLILFIGLVLIVAWWMISAADLGTSVVSPLEALFGVKALILGEPAFIEHGESIWRNLGTSLFEIALGSFVGGGIAMLMRFFCREISRFKSILLHVFGLSYVMMLAIPAFISQLYFGMWFSVVTVALISFFPSFCRLVAFEDYSWRCQFLLALEGSFPYAFVAMLFGESIQGAGGLGLSMMVASAFEQTVKSSAVAVVTVLIFVTLAVSIRGLLRRTCFARG